MSYHLAAKDHEGGTKPRTAEMDMSEGQTKTIRVSRKGRTTIPADFRRQLGIDEETMVRMSLIDGELRIVPLRGPDPVGISDWLRELYDFYAPVREEILRRGISEEVVNADIDAAIAAVRAEQRAKKRKERPHRRSRVEGIPGGQVD